MSGTDESSHEHQVGITNAQEKNPDLTIAELTAEMNARFASGDYSEAARIAFSITALGKEDLRQTFERHGVRVLHLDHEAFGIYEVIEPSYQNIKIETAVEIVDVVRDCGFKGATFAPKRNGEVSIYHTDDLRMTTDQFRKAANLLVVRLRTLYPQAQYTVDPYLVLMPKL
ncbi:MAG: hypothetical protein ACREHD_01690 [Pirellulales bacterium]